MKQENPPRPQQPAEDEKSELLKAVEQDFSALRESQKLGIDLGPEWAESANERRSKLAGLVQQVEDVAAEKKNRKANGPLVLSGKEPGPWKNETWQNTAMEEARERDMLVLTGSIPPPRASKGGQENAIREARKKGKLVLSKLGEVSKEPVKGITDLSKNQEAYEKAMERSATDNPRAHILAERANVAEERALMQDATRKHAEARANFYKNAGTGLLSPLFRRLRGEKDAVELSSLKRLEERAQLAYSSKLEASVLERLKASGKSDSEIEKVQARYNRLIQFKEVVKPAFDARQAAKKEGMNAKEKNALEKGGAWFQKKNEQLERAVGKTGARAVRLVVTSAIATGAVAGLGALGLIGGVAVGTYAGTRLWRGAWSVFGGATIGAAAGKGYQMARSEINAEKSKVARSGSIKSAKDMKRQMDSYTAGTKEGMEQRRKVVEMVTAALVGAGISYDMAYDAAQNEAVQEAVQQSAADPEAPLRIDVVEREELQLEKPGEIMNTMDGVEDAPTARDSFAFSDVAPAEAVPADTAPVETAPSDVAPMESAPAEAAPVQEPTVPASNDPENLLKGATIERGEGFNHLIVGLREAIDADLPGIKEGSSAVMKLIYDTDATVLSEKLDAIKGLESMVMQPGDHAFFDDNENVWFEKVGGGAPQLVLENDPTAPGGVRFHPFEGVEMREPIPASVDSTPVEAEVQTPAAERVETESVGAPEDTSRPYLDVVAEDSGAPVANAEAVATIPEDIDPVVENDPVEAARPSPEPEAPTSGDPQVRTVSLNEALAGFGAQPNVATPEYSPSIGSVPDPTEGIKTVSTEEAIAAFREAPVSGAFTNGFGVEINPTEPAAYSWDVPGSDMKHTVAHGGSPAEYSNWARDYVLAHPTEKVYFANPDVLTDAGTPRIDAWSMDPNGVPERTEGMMDHVTGRPLNAPDPRDFITKLP